MKKRSKSVALCIVGAAAFTLAGCQEEQIDAQAFPDLQSCKAGADVNQFLSADECDIAFAQAQQVHVESAPRYDSLQVCEDQHGAGACGNEEQAVQGGSSGIFMPLLTGYLIGNMLSGRSGMSAAQPMYRKAGGGFTNAAGTSAYSSNAGKAKLNSAQFAKPATTAGKPPMTKASVASRGGFGKSKTGGKSFGG
ncbi:MAG: DUF1190 domain-containing protein [Cognatishimia sp.]